MRNNKLQLLFLEEQLFSCPTAENISHPSTRCKTASKVICEEMSHLCGADFFPLQSPDSIHQVAGRSEMLGLDVLEPHDTETEFGDSLAKDANTKVRSCT